MVGFQGWWREVRLAEADVGLAAGLAELADAVRQREQALVDVPAFAPLQLAEEVFSRLCSQATAHVLTRCYRLIRMRTNSSRQLPILGVRSESRNPRVRGVDRTKVPISTRLDNGQAQKPPIQTESQQPTQFQYSETT